MYIRVYIYVDSLYYRLYRDSLSICIVHVRVIFVQLIRLALDSLLKSIRCYIDAVTCVCVTSMSLISRWIFIVYDEAHISSAFSRFQLINW